MSVMPMHKTGAKEEIPAVFGGSVRGRRVALKSEITNRGMAVAR